MTERKKYAVIVAGGKGVRMGSALPKQFIPVNGLPVLIHTIRIFSQAGCSEIILVLPESQLNTWETLCSEYAFRVPHRITAGGAERFDSVKNGLGLVNDNGLVAIHDGVRPCVSQQVISRCFSEAAIHGNAIAAVKLKDSLRMIQGNASVGVNRDLFFLVQTPQVFDAQLLKQAYNQPYETAFTDDAAVFEAAGHVIHLTEGDYRNIKITTSEDLVLAASFL